MTPNLPFMLDGLRKAAAERGVAFKTDAEFGWVAQLRYPDGQVRYVRNTMLDINGAGSSMLADSKAPSLLLLGDGGIPIPTFKRFVHRRGRTAAELIEAAKGYAEQIGFPVIVRSGETGTGIGGIVVATGDGLQRAVRRVLARTRKVLIQRWIEGDCLRFCILNDEVLLTTCLSGSGSPIPDNAIELARAAARLSGLRFCTIDVVVPIRVKGARVVRVDSSPDLEPFGAAEVDRLFGRLIDEMGRAPKPASISALAERRRTILERAAAAAGSPLWTSLHERFSRLTNTEEVRFETGVKFGRVGRFRYTGGKVRHLYVQHCDINRRAAFYLSNAKAWSLEFLRVGGFHVPRSGWFFADQWATDIGSSRNEAAALQFARDLGFPCVVKPNSDSFGRGVHVVSNEETFLTTVRSVLALEPSFLVQELIDGIEYRIVVLGDEVYYILEKQALAVTGDGTHTIQELLEAHLANLVAQRGRSFVATRINDSRIEAYLQYSGRKREDVPPAGERVQLVLNARGGGYGVVAADAVPAAVLQAAVDMTHDAGLRYCGLDIKIPPAPDPRSYCVLELNPSPDLRGYAGLGGKRREAVERLVFTLLDRMGSEDATPVQTVAKDRKPGPPQGQEGNVCVVRRDPMAYKPRFRVKGVP
jgi:glutathione synthase/RimK-type ligase-like ATP-grasp enzyme